MMGYIDNGISSRVGKATELLVAATCILASGAELSVSTSIVDDDGIDLVFHHRDGTATLSAQVKARTTDTTIIQRQNRFMADVRPSTFRPRPDRFLLFVVVDTHEATFGPVWLVPSIVFNRQALRISNGKLRFSASTHPMTKDPWSVYRMQKTALHHHILRTLSELERYASSWDSEEAAARAR